jgi:hypothetical protein
MCEMSLPILASASCQGSRRGLLAGQSGNTRTTSFAGSKSRLSMRRALLGPNMVPGCHPYVTLLVSPGPWTASSQIKTPLTVYKCATYHIPPTPGEWLLRCIT